MAVQFDPDWEVTPWVRWYRWGQENAYWRDHWPKEFLAEVEQAEAKALEFALTYEQSHDDRSPEGAH